MPRLGVQSDRVHSSVDAHAGVGFLVSPLNCTRAAMEQEGTYDCNLPSQNFTGYDIREVPGLPHTYYTRSCTINSLNITNLWLTRYALQSITAGNDSSLTGSFTLFNPGSGDEYKLRDIPIHDDGQWHNCISGALPVPWQLISCEYALSSSAKTIRFKIQWYCDDRDPEHAYVHLTSRSPSLSKRCVMLTLVGSILFNATAQGKLPDDVVKCVDTDKGGTRICSLGGSPRNLDLGITSISWNTTDGPMGRGPLLPWV
jgi:hypothetical protein